jgi:hypothetical protein
MIGLMVTQKHVDVGTPVEHDACPIAWALKEKYKTDQVSVHADGIDIAGHRYRHTESSRRLMLAFDDEERVVLPAFITFEA